MELFLNHAGYHPNRPVLVGVNLDGYFRQQRVDVANWLEKAGLPILYESPDNALQAVLDKVPDTLGMNQTDIDRLPPYIRSFKCGGLIEDGDPYCGLEKFTLDLCPQRRYKSSWHPGWYVRLHPRPSDLSCVLLTLFSPLTGNDKLSLESCWLCS
jgi:hypothetical protein